MGPGHGVHAVRDGADLVAGERAPCGLRMALGDAIDVAAQVQTELRHVEMVASAKTPYLVGLDEIAEEPLHELVRELIVAG